MSLRKYTGQDGFYAAYEVHEKYHRTLQLIQSEITLDTFVEDFHCTLMYSVHNVPSKPYEIPEHIIVHLANMDLFTFPGGNAVVVHVHNPDIYDIHKKLNIAGACHSYREYNPHITIGYVERATERLIENIWRYNAEVKRGRDANGDTYYHQDPYTPNLVPVLLHKPYHMDIVE